MAAAELLVLDAPGDDATRVDPDGEVGVGHELDAAPAKLANCRRVAAMPGRDRRLAEGWNEDSAADMMFALATSDLVEALMIDRGWSASALADRLMLVLSSTFVRPPRR